MAVLLDTYITLEKLETLVKTVKAKNTNGLAITLRVGDELDNYGHSVKAWVSQSKEDQDAGKQKYYVGNGKCLWYDGKVTLTKDMLGDVAGIPAGSDVIDEGLPF
jgi:hypothetical protein